MEEAYNGNGKYVGMALLKEQDEKGAFRSFVDKVLPDIKRRTYEGTGEASKSHTGIESGRRLVPIVVDVVHNAHLFVQETEKNQIGFKIEG